MVVELLHQFFGCEKNLEPVPGFWLDPVSHVMDLGLSLCFENSYRLPGPTSGFQVQLDQQQ